MKKLFQIVLVTSLSLLCFSCYYDELIERPIPEIPTDPDDPGYEEISYSTDIQPIFDNNCVSCHGGSTAPNLRSDVSYNELVPEYVVADDADSSRLYLQVESGHGGLTVDELALIKGWINQGAAPN